MENSEGGASVLRSSRVWMVVKSTRGSNGLSVKSYTGSEGFNKFRVVKHNENLLASVGSLMIFTLGVEVFFGELGEMYAGATTDSYRLALEDDPNSNIKITDIYVHKN